MKTELKLHVLTAVLAALTVCVSAQAIPAHRTCETVEYVLASTDEILNGLESAVSAIAAVPVPGLQAAGLVGFGLKTDGTVPSTAACDWQWLADQLTLINTRYFYLFEPHILSIKSIYAFSHMCY